MASGRRDEPKALDAPAKEQEHRVLVADQQCPRCQKFFTMSYWNGANMVQARCLSCDLKWPRPDVV